MAWVGLPDALLSAMVFDLFVDLIVGGDAWAGATNFFPRKKVPPTKKTKNLISTLSGFMVAFEA